MLRLLLPARRRWTGTTTLLFAALLATLPAAANYRDAERARETKPAPILIEAPAYAPRSWSLALPATSAAALACANNSTDEWWAVAHAGPDRLRVSRHRESDIQRLPLAGGELVGVNRGEFGGQLEWTPRDGARELVQADVNPVAMIPRGENVFVATGLAHGGVERGDVRRLRRDDRGLWHVDDRIDLGSAPVAAYRTNDRAWWLVTTRGLVLVDLQAGTRRLVHANPHWGMLYPTTLRPLGDAWFIGARHAVIRLTRDGNGFTEQWLVPAQCKPRDWGRLERSR
jgi:hypothetical protein